MRTFVRFRTHTGDYALAVEHVREICLATDLTPLPTARPGVAGVVARGGDVLTVLSVLGDTGRQIIVLDADQLAFGLLVDEVSGVDRFDDDAIGPPPQGQDGGGVDGVILEGGNVVLVLDPAKLRSRLRS